MALLLAGSHRARKWPLLTPSPKAGPEGSASPLPGNQAAGTVVHLWYRHICASRYLRENQTGPLVIIP